MEVGSCHNAAASARQEGFRLAQVLRTGREVTHGCLMDGMNLREWPHTQMRRSPASTEKVLSETDPSDMRCCSRSGRCSLGYLASGIAASREFRFAQLFRTRRIASCEKDWAVDSGAKPLRCTFISFSNLSKILSTRLWILSSRSYTIDRSTEGTC